MKKRSMMASLLVAAMLVGALPVSAAGTNDRQIVNSGAAVLDSERSAQGAVSVNALALPTSQENQFRIRLDVTTTEDLREMTVKEGDAAVLIIVDKSTSMNQNGPIVQDTEGLAAVLDQYADLGLTAADLPLSTRYDKATDQLADVDAAVAAAYAALLPQADVPEEDAAQPPDVYTVEEDVQLPPSGPDFTLAQVLTQIRDCYHYRSWFERQAVIDFLDSYTSEITDGVSRYFALGTFHQDASIKADWSKLDADWRSDSSLSRAALDYSFDLESWTSDTRSGSALTYTKGSGTNVAGAYLLARNMMHVGFDPEVGYFREEGIDDLHVILITDGEPSSKLRSPSEQLLSDPTVGFDVTRDDSGAITAYALKDNAKIKGERAVDFDELRQVAGMVAQDDLFQLTAVRYGDYSDTSRESLFQDGGGDYCDTYEEVRDTDLADLLMSKVFQETVPAVSTVVYPWTVTLPMGQQMVYAGPDPDLDLGADDRVSFSDGTLTWDLTQSEPASTTATETGQEHLYQYQFLARLDNTQDGFLDQHAYDVAGTTVLDYQIKTETAGKATFDAGSLNFEVPQVQGYLGQLVFDKVDGNGAPLGGAAFELALNGSNERWSATSGPDGKVSFSVPSGHGYALTETQAPQGYTGSDATYDVTVSYGESGVHLDGVVIPALQVVNTAIPGEPVPDPDVPDPDVTGPDETAPDVPDPDVSIPDPDVPLADQTPDPEPATDIADQDAPLSGLPEQEEQEIAEELVPLDASPKTSDMLGIWGPMSALSGAALLLLALTEKKRRDTQTR